MANSRASINEKLKSLFNYDEESASNLKLKQYREMACEHAKKGEMSKVIEMLINVSDVSCAHIDGVPDGKDKQVLADEFNVHILVASLFGQSLNGAFNDCSGVKKAMETVPGKYWQAVAECVISNSPHNHIWPEYTPVDFRFGDGVLNLLKTYSQPTVSIAKNGLFSAQAAGQVSQEWVEDNRYTYGN